MAAGLAQAAPRLTAGKPQEIGSSLGRVVQTSATWHCAGSASTRTWVEELGDRGLAPVMDAVDVVGWSTEGRGFRLGLAGARPAQPPAALGGMGGALRGFDTRLARSSRVATQPASGRDLWSGSGVSIRGSLVPRESLLNQRRGGMGGAVPGFRYAARSFLASRYSTSVGAGWAERFRGFDTRLARSSRVATQPASGRDGWSGSGVSIRGSLVPRESLLNQRRGGMGGAVPGFRYAARSFLASRYSTSVGAGWVERLRGFDTRLARSSRVATQPASGRDGWSGCGVSIRVSLVPRESLLNQRRVGAFGSVLLPGRCCRCRRRSAGG